MKKILVIIVILLVIVLGFVYVTINRYSDDLKWTQEYIIGEDGIKGEVDVTIFGSNPAYEIGANKYGYAVFKNPDLALRKAKIDFDDAISFIRKEYHFFQLSNRNYKKYLNVGWQLDIDDENVKQQGILLSSFLDIYENSFEK